MPDRCAHVPQDERVGTLGDRLRHVAATHLDYRRRSALRLLIAFAVTFGLIRLLTFAIHNNLGPFHDIVIGNPKAGASLHIHHYMWGLALLIVCGFLLVLLEAEKWHPRLAIPFGIGLALVIDEFALLLNLRDTYWTPAGFISIQVGVALLALLLAYYLGQCFWHDAAREIRKGFGYVRAAEHHIAERA